MARKKQQGVVLILSLIMLAVVSIIAISSIRLTDAEQIMSNNYFDKSKALKNAEFGVSFVENWIVRQEFTYYDFLQNSCLHNNCFNEKCLNGLCLSYKLNDYGECVDSNPVKNVGLEHYIELNNKQISIWDDDEYHSKLDLKEFNYPAKYIIEFVCFNKNNNSVEIVNYKDVLSWSPLFRITLIAYGVNSANKVMLQTYFTIGNV